MKPRRVVIDNSVLVAWALGEPSSHAEAVISSLAEVQASAPAIWPLELANALVVAERRGRITEGQMLQIRDLIAGLPIEVVPQLTQRVLSDVLLLARAHRLSTYDAAYLDLAMSLGAELATLDVKLREAARVAGVPIAGPA